METVNDERDLGFSSEHTLNAQSSTLWHTIAEPFPQNLGCDSSHEVVVHPPERALQIHVVDAAVVQFLIDSFAITVSVSCVLLPS